MNFEGQVAVVTGAASGIGKAVAQYLAARGATIVGVDLSDIQWPEGSPHLSYATDLRDDYSAHEVVESIIAKLGRIDILVNSAAIIHLDKAEDFPTNLWKKTLDTNLSASFYMCQAVARPMLKAGYGRIINMASQASEVGLDGHVAYCASKAGVVGMTRAMSLEWAPRGITVNAVSPTIVETSLSEKAWGSELAARSESAKQQIPTGRFATPEEVASFVAYLASEEAAMITGTNMLVDGGRTSS